MIRVVPQAVRRMLERRCPYCNRTESRRAPRRDFFEAVVLRLACIAPFRCGRCSIRFYGFGFGKDGATNSDAKATADLSQDVPVLVYGRGKDEEPFREETNVRLLNVSAGLVSLSTNVEPGQQLILINLATEKDQSCHVAFVAEKCLGRSVIGVRFNQPPWDLVGIAGPPSTS
jgi:hypothetical protein